MKFINDLKKLMYDKGTNSDIGLQINDIIFEFDKHRSNNIDEELRAGKQWEYRLKKYCDYRASILDQEDL